MTKASGGTVQYVCTVCRREVRPAPDGKILFVGVRRTRGPGRWVWGPEPCHRTCQPIVHTPYDERLRDGPYVRTWQRMAA